MRDYRIYHPAPLTEHTQISLCDTAATHVARVLRLPVGTPLRLFDGTGVDYNALIQQITKRQVLVHVGEKQPNDCESPLALHLGQGISRGERMDVVIQKATELGVTQLTPLITERCTVKLNDERWQKRWQHWQAIAISACEQCGRSQLLTVNAPLAYTAWLNQLPACVKLVLSPQGKMKLPDIPLATDACLLIGPEGGLTPLEIEDAQAKDFQALSLGQRILRTETAAIVAVGLLQYQWGDLSR